MLFSKKKIQNTEVEEKGTNPYLNAKNEWYERYGSYIKQAHNWRKFSFMALLIATISIVGNVMQANQVKVVPYIIEVDKLGHTQVIGKAIDIQTLPEHLIQATLANCISDWRTVTADIELQKKMIQRLTYFFVGSSKNVIGDWYKSNNPYEIAKDNKLVHVEIKSLPLPISSDSYRIEWLEIVRNHTGAELERQMYEATITVQIQIPQNVNSILNNPAGIYITAVSATPILLNKD